MTQKLIPLFEFLRLARALVCAALMFFAGTVLMDRSSQAQEIAFLDDLKKTLEDVDNAIQKELGIDSDESGKSSSNKPQGPAENKTFEPGEQSATHLNRDRTAVTEAQKKLNELGYNVGRPDGLYGNATRRGIESFQRDNKLPVTGNVTQLLLSQLSNTPQSVTQRPTASPNASGPLIVQSQSYGGSSTLSKQTTHPIFGRLFHTVQTNGLGHQVDYYVKRIPPSHATQNQVGTRIFAVHHTDTSSPLIPLVEKNDEGLRKIRYSDEYISYFRNELAPALKSVLGPDFSSAFVSHYVAGHDRLYAKQPFEELDQGERNDLVLFTWFRIPSSRVFVVGHKDREPYLVKEFVPRYVPGGEDYDPGNWDFGGWFDQSDLFWISNTYDVAQALESGSIIADEIEYTTPTRGISAPPAPPKVSETRKTNSPQHNQESPIHPGDEITDSEIVDMSWYIYASLVSKDEVELLSKDDYTTITRNILKQAKKDRRLPASRNRAPLVKHVFTESDLDRPSDFVVFENWERVKELAEKVINSPQPRTVRVNLTSVGYNYSFEEKALIPESPFGTSSFVFEGGDIYLKGMLLPVFSEYSSRNALLFEVGRFILSYPAVNPGKFEKIRVPRVIELDKIPMSPAQAESLISEHGSGSYLGVTPVVTITDLEPGVDNPSGRIVKVLLTGKNDQPILEIRP